MRAARRGTDSWSVARGAVSESNRGARLERATEQRESSAVAYDEPSAHNDVPHGGSVGDDGISHGAGREVGPSPEMPGDDL